MQQTCLYQLIMKRIIAILFAFALLTSCEDVQDSQSALQATLDFNLYDAIGTRAAENEDGSYLIQGITQNEILTMKVPSLEEGTYVFGGNSENYALFENSNDETYFTNPDGGGNITITDWNQDEELVSGSFKFRAILSGADTLKASEGLFYRVEVTRFVDGADASIDPSTNAGTFVSAVDGIPFNPFEVSALEAGDCIFIKASTTNREIEIKLPLDIQSGTIMLPEPGFIVKYKGGDGEEDAISGNIILFQHQPTIKRIKGTFSFETETKSISLGQFNVFYQ